MLHYTYTTCTSLAIYTYANIYNVFKDIYTYIYITN